MSDEIVVSKSAKINTGNYESADVFVSMKRILDPALDDYKSSHAELSRLVNDAVLADIVSHYKARGKKETRKQLARQYGLIPGE